MTKHYQPKGSMCMSCTKARDDCSKLDFSKMSVNQTIGDTVIVICNQFKRTNYAKQK